MTPLRPATLLLLGVTLLAGPACRRGGAPEAADAPEASEAPASAASTALPSSGSPGSPGAPALLTFQEAHMGTRFTIRVWAEAEAAGTVQEAVQESFSRVAALERVFSDYQVDSEIVRLTAQAPGKAIPISGDLFAVLDRTQALSRETAGAFDITVGPMVRLWRQARKDTRLPDPERIAQARERTGWQ